MFGITAERMAVRPDVPWYWRIAVVIFFMAAIGWAAFGLLRRESREADAERELAHMQQSLAQQNSELEQLRLKSVDGERQVQMDRAAAADLAKQVKTLTFENAKLKEDLAFFQSLMSSSSGAREGSITVNRFKLQPESVAGEYRYQLLLVQTGQRVREFHGTLQFVLDVQNAGRKLVLVLPPEGERDAHEYRLNFKFFQRVEGTFKLTPGSVLRGMQIRVYENGARTPRLSQPLNVS